MSELSERVDAIFSEWTKPGSPGGTLAVVKDGEIIYKKGYGLANLEYDLPNTPSTIFHVASVSKQFAAWAVTHLAAQGKLSIDDEVRKYIPELPDFGEKITIRHLLHHTSGLRDQWELLILAGWRMDDVITTDDVLELVSRQCDLNFKPGAEYTYCNTGYTLLGLIVKKVTGQSLREFTGEHLFTPLGMKDTHFHDDHQMIVPNRSYSYEPKPEGGFRNAVLSYATVGATSLFTTVEDLARWDENFYTGKVGGMAVIEQMHCQGMLNDGKQIPYAFGLVIGKYRGIRTVEHSGADAGYRTNLLRFPEQHFSVIVFSNLSTAAPGELSRRVADLYLEEVFTEKAPAHKDPVTVPAEELEKLAGIYIHEASHQTFQLKMRRDRLVIDLDTPFMLIPYGNNQFGIQGLGGIELTFKPAEGDRPSGFEMGGMGEAPLFFALVPPAEYSEKELASFGGIYTSPELEVSYIIAVEDGKLQLKRRKYGTKALQPTHPDTFNTEMIDLKFFRDTKNKPAGFLVSTGRVRNLRFERQK